MSKQNFFKVYVNYEMTGTLIIQASSAEQAEKIASKMLSVCDVSDLGNAEAVDGTMTVLHDATDLIR